MATNNSTVRKGRCINFGNCNKANAKEIISINIGDEFECLECRSILVELPPPRTPWFLIIAGILAVLGVSGYFVYKFFAGSDKPIKETEQKEQVIEHPIIPDNISLDQTTVSLKKAGETAQLTATIFPDSAENKTVIWQSGDMSVATVSETGLVTAVSAGNAIIMAYTGNGFSASCNVTVNEDPPVPKRTYGTITVPGGIYKGQVKDGKPDGEGTIRYNSHTLIDSRDMKKRYAEAGQRITGQFENGHLLQGKLFNSEEVHIETIIP
ncbi:MAG: Ig-like domain-containing protein [Paludibacter sp.]|jgi:hypothetical protein|nr:Ig-like domain-containing protein [Paludibacter sp.]